MAYSKEARIKNLAQQYEWEAAETRSLYNKWIFSKDRERDAFNRLTVAQNALKMELLSEANELLGDVTNK